MSWLSATVKKKNNNNNKNHNFRTYQKTHLLVKKKKTLASKVEIINQTDFEIEHPSGRVKFLKTFSYKFLYYSR